MVRGQGKKKNYCVYMCVPFVCQAVYYSVDNKIHALDCHFVILLRFICIWRCRLSYNNFRGGNQINV